MVYYFYYAAILYCAAIFDGIFDDIYSSFLEFMHSLVRSDTAYVDQLFRCIDPGRRNTNTNAANFDVWRSMTDIKVSHT